MLMQAYGTTFIQSYILFEHCSCRKQRSVICPNITAQRYIDASTCLQVFDEAPKILLAKSLATFQHKYSTITLRITKETYFILFRQWTSPCSNTHFIYIIFIPFLGWQGDCQGRPAALHQSGMLRSFRNQPRRPLRPNRYY